LAGTGSRPELQLTPGQDGEEDGMCANAPLSASQLTIRVLTQDDLGEVSRLARTSGEGDNSYPIDRLELEMSGKSEEPPPEGRLAFGAFADGRLAAVGCGRVEEGAVGYVSRVYTGSELRGRGVGRRLVRVVESYLATRGCDKAYLYCYGPNVATQRFWMKMGYHRVFTAAHSHDGTLGWVVKCEKALDG
jgi:GNAT superfamily N-acetyltransferase